MDQARSGLTKLPETQAVLEVRRAVRRWLARYSPDGVVAVGLSGGADSLALLAGAVAEATVVRALIVDHQLQAGSNSVAEAAAAQAEALGAQACILRVDVGRDGGLEAAARSARYDALDSARNGAPVLIGHTLDDQAETVLLGLARGSGPRSMWGMREFSEPWGRPLLEVRRPTTRQLCADLGLVPHEDPHNFAPEFTRVRLRHEALPLLDEILGGGVAEALSRTAQQLRDDGDVLDHIAESVCGEASGPDGLNIARLSAEPAAIRRRAIRLWLLSGGAKAVTGKHVEAIDRLVTHWRGQGAVAVGGGTADARLVVIRKHGNLALGSGSA